MASYVTRRILNALLIVFIVSVLAFVFMHIIPGDPVRMAMGVEASEEDVQRMREQLNLNEPLVKQYILWIKGLLHGDLGVSIVYDRTVADLIAERMPRTLAIGIPAMMIAIIVGIGFGLIGALKRGTVLDQIITVLSTLGIGTPVFWIGMVCIYIFAIWLKVLPMQGYTAPSTDFLEYVRKAIMPVFCLSLGMIASLARQTRSNMLEVINQDYIRSARANGLGQSSIIFRHALRNAVIPIITIIAMQVRIIIGGTLMVEKVFNVPGIGQLLTTAIGSRDYWVVQSFVLIISLITVAANLIVDLLYGVADPRIRKSRG